MSKLYTYLYKAYNWYFRPDPLQELIKKGLVVGKNFVMLNGVKIGSNVLIGAGSVVSHDIPDRVVAAGNPAKVIEPIERFLLKRKEEMKIYPCFGAEYTIEENITDKMKYEMKKNGKF